MAQGVGLETFELNGSGLEAELPHFLGEMKAQDGELAAVLEKHLPLLVDLRTDDDRRAARAAFNEAVKADLLAFVKQVK